MARKRATLTDLLNDLTYKTVYDKYKLLAMNAFEWEGLPDGIEARHIERQLYSKGQAIFFRDERMSYMCLECSQTGEQNVYGEPTHYTAHGVNYQEVYDVDNCVIVENNLLKIPTKPFIQFYVNKLTESERTMDVNVKANKTPIIVMCDDKDVLSFKKLISDVDGNTPAIYADRNLNIEAVKALDMKVRFLGNELMSYKKSVENELLTFLGLNNIPNDKKERQIVDEVNANNQLIDSFSDLQYEARKRACEAINTLYPGLNVSVKRRVERGVEYVDKQPIQHE